jgi:glutaredoxin-like protein NrdH
MRKNGVDYIEEDAISHLDDLKTMGFMAAPVVMTDQTNWSGYRPDLIDALTTVNV